MNCRNLLTTLLTLLLVTGCKIVVQVPVGGQVITQSGGYKACAAGKTCVIDVVDLFFNEAFIAKPASGYVFKHWKSKARAFCGDHKGACRLQSTLLGIDPSLTALLESDERFFLQPVFVKKSGGGSVGKQNAAVCFNSKLAAPGAEWITNFRSRDKTFGDITRARIKTRFTGYVMYKGVRALRALSDITIPGDTSFKSNSVTYSDPDIARKRFSNLGGEGSTTVNGQPSGSTTTEFVPPQLMRFDLAAGQSYTQNYTIKSTITFGAIKNSSSQALKQTTTYIGVVKITVPAGMYDTCKFREVTTTTFQGFGVKNTRTIWFGVGNGIQIKEENESSITELTSGTLNGANI